MELKQIPCAVLGQSEDPVRVCYGFIYNWLSQGIRDQFPGDP